MQRTNIYLEPAQTEKLDRLARAEGVSRAELIRRMIDRELAGADDLDADLAVFAGSFGALRDVEVAPRRGDERSRHLDHEWGAE